MDPLCFWFCIYEYLFPQSQVSTKKSPTEIDYALSLPIITPSISETQDSEHKALGMT